MHVRTCLSPRHMCPLPASEQQQRVGVIPVQVTPHPSVQSSGESPAARTVHRALGSGCPVGCIRSPGVAGATRKVHP